MPLFPPLNWKLDMLADPVATEKGCCYPHLIPTPYQQEFSQSLPHNLHVKNFRWIIFWLGEPGSYAYAIAVTELGKCYLMFSVHYGRRNKFPVFQSHKETIP